MCSLVFKTSGVPGTLNTAPLHLAYMPPNNKYLIGGMMLQQPSNLT